MGPMTGSDRAVAELDRYRKDLKRHRKDSAADYDSATLPPIFADCNLAVRLDRAFLAGFIAGSAAAMSRAAQLSPDASTEE